MLLAFSGPAATMTSMGWSRQGRKGAFRYFDARGTRITDEAKLARIEELAIPPAWKDVWISPRRAREAPGDGLRRGRAEAVPLPPGISRGAGAGEVRQADPLRRAAAGAARRDGASTRPGAGSSASASPRSRCGSSTLGWFRVGSRAIRARIGTYGVTTLLQAPRERARQPRPLAFRGKHGSACAPSSSTPSSPRRCASCSRCRGRARLQVRAGRASLYNLTSKRLNEYVKIYSGEEFTAKDFRTWGGTLLAAISLAERGRPEPNARRSGRSPRSCGRRGAARKYTGGRRASYVAPAVDRAVPRRENDRRFPASAFARRRAREVGLDRRRKRRLLSLLRSWRIRRARAAA